MAARTSGERTTADVAEIDGPALAAVPRLDELGVDRVDEAAEAENIAASKLLRV